MSVPVGPLPPARTAGRAAPRRARLFAAVTLVLAVGAGLLATVPQATAAGRTYTDVVQSGQRLRAGDVVVSHNRLYRLKLAPKLGATTWGPNGPVWASMKRMPHGSYAEMHTDGTFVMYDRDRRVLWQSGTSGNPGAILRMQDDGNLVIYSAGRAIWASSSTAVSRTFAERAKRRMAARALRDDPGVDLIRYHVTGHNHPESAARHNIVETAEGGAALRSHWAHAGNTRVFLKSRMLDGMVQMRTRYGYTYRVTSIAGGVHGPRSRHYAGLAFDVNFINGVRVNSRNPHFRGFMQACRALGATEVLGPGHRGHSGHVHCAWPR